VINARQGHEVLLHVYGFGLTNESEIKLTSSAGEVGLPCKSKELHVQTMRYATEVNLKKIPNINFELEIPKHQGYWAQKIIVSMN